MMPQASNEVDLFEVRNVSFCSLTMVKDETLTDHHPSSSWSELVQTAYDNLEKDISEVAVKPTYQDAEFRLLKQCQLDSFPQEPKTLKTGKSLSTRRSPKH